MLVSKLEKISSDLKKAGQIEMYSLFVDAMYGLKK